VLEGGIDLLVGRQPVSSPLMQLSYLLGRPGGLEPVLKELLDQVVVAKPLPLLVQRDHEQI
jgi:hypothetical protein